MDIRILMTAALMAAALHMPVCLASAQDDGKSENPQAEAYAEKYDLLLSRLGPDGVGIETLLDKWAAAAPDDIRMLKARFSYYFTKAQRTEVVPKDMKKFMGADPVLTLKDSTGNDVRYFQEIVYDDSLYTLSMGYLDKAIRLDSDRLDLRVLKATSLISYEKESPDMALAYLEKLIDENMLVKGKWKYPGVEVTDTVFKDIVQEYCYSFFNIGSDKSFDAFYDLSVKMLDYYPGTAVFMDNIGSYYLVVKKDEKTALKYYNKVLKKNPEDYIAVKNCVIIARKQKNAKLEKKYLQMLVACTEGTEKAAAEARLKAL